MKNTFIILLVCIGLSISIGTPAFSKEKVIVIEGKINVIRQDYLILNEERYTIVNNSESLKKGPECWIIRLVDSYRVNFDTLYQSGHIHKARVTIQNGVVKKIEVLELQH